MTQEAADQLEISLYAITRKQNAKTMQLQAIMKGQTLRSLVDSGSTHNFISDIAAQHLGLQILPKSNLYVSVANGEKVPCTGIYQRVRFSIADNFFFGRFLYNSSRWL